MLRVRKSRTSAAASGSAVAADVVVEDAQHQGGQPGACAVVITGEDRLEHGAGIKGEFDHGQEQVAFAAEVVGDQHRVHPSLQPDLAQRGPFIAEFGEQFACGVLDQRLRGVGSRSPPGVGASLGHRCRPPLLTPEF
jgi:hypothetical protein